MKTALSAIKVVSLTVPIFGREFVKLGGCQFGLVLKW
jgi:hypothetical protein